MAGRLCLIDSVVMGSFLHSFQVYRWPSSLLKDLNAAIRNIFWTGSIDGLKSVQVAWKSCYRTKDSGGLGVKDLGLLNKAMLKKFTWRMLTAESFVFTYLRARFFTQDHRPRTWYVVSSVWPGWDIPESFRASHPDVASEIEKVVISTDPDSLFWTCSLDGVVSYKSAYDSLSEVRSSAFWEEDLRHLFPNCLFARGLWDAVSSTFSHKLKLDGICLDLWHEAMMVVFSTQLKALWRVNTDGDAFGSPGLAGCAGVFRTCRGFFKGCFAIPLIVCFAFEAELAAAVHTIDYAWTFGWRRLWLESDSTFVVDTLRSRSYKVPWRWRPV
ncbi:hypothetical protein Dsin_023352 [Dipteronia sinensis]|uniref:RNase H type-1 domain-containing protein n=1 Tax=Dipteronia sinensis TaxID=43782 RepID=A0AAE0A431_9ROSI|nr:hypothetical protein Dsin_023352 [Dipteronia sinensis]